MYSLPPMQARRSPQTIPVGQMIQAETKKLEDFFNRWAKPRNPQIAHQRLYAYMQLLSTTECQIAVEVTIHSFACALCKRRIKSPEGTLSLECQCLSRVCSRECFRSYLYEASGKNVENIYYVQCPMCWNYFPPTQVR